MFSPFEFESKHWKKLMLLPIIAFILSLIILINTAINTGFILERNVELTGGKQIVVSVKDVDIKTLENAFPESKIQVTKGLINTIQLTIKYEEDENLAIEKLKSLVEFESEPSISSIGPTLGELFFQQAIISFLVAFVLMSIVVFVLFRSPVPSGIVILSVIFDITITMAAMNILGIELSVPVLAALLTLIGYSVDTDILLTTNMIRSRETPINERVANGMKTGIFMTLTTLAALASLYFATGSFVLERIALVLIIGLIADIFVTWFTNVGILRLYMERKKK